MSLSFVSKSVQTVTEDGEYEEKPIEGSTLSSETTSGKPLFEQLRQNKEQADAEREEYERSVMRGTLALDEEDAAHIEFLNKQKREREEQRQKETHQEVAMFRAAQAVLLEQQSSDIVDNTQLIANPDYIPTDSSEIKLKAESYRQKNPSNILPKISVKRRKTDQVSEPPVNEDKSSSTAENYTMHAAETPIRKEVESNLSGLLSGYGSASDDD
jgi:hypothetical protein